MTKRRENRSTNEPTDIVATEVPVPVKDETVPEKFTLRLTTALSVLADNTTMLTPAVITAAQASFYHGLIRGLVLGTDEEAKKFIGDILTVINENPHAFQSSTAYRHFDNLAKHGINAVKAKEFEVLLAILKDTAARETRMSNAKSMSWNNIEAAFKSDYNQILLDRLKNFYKI